VGDRRRLLTTQNQIPVSVTAYAFATGGQIADYEHAKGVFASYLDLTPESNALTSTLDWLLSSF